MIAAWMVYAAFVAMLIAAATLLVERGVIALRRPTRWLWVGAVALSLAAPVLGAWIAKSAPPVEVERIDPASVGDIGGVGAVVGAPTLARRSPTMLERIRSRGIEVAGVLDRPLLGAWAMGSLLFIGIVALGVVRLARARRTWALALVDEQLVRVSEDTGPAVVGFVRQEIVLPEWAVSMAPAQRAMLLAHEREHVGARDPLLLVVGLFAVMLAPWNVALWWQLRRLRLAVEMDCDARVLRRCADVRGYGALLIEVGRRTVRMPLAAAAFSEPVTDLERRIHMMLARPPRWRTLRALTLSAAGLALAFIACDMNPPVAPNPEAEVPLEELGRNDRSYNVREMAGESNLYRAVATHFPELIGAADDTLWIVQFVQSPDGRIVQANKIPDERAMRASRERELVGDRAASLVEVRRLMSSPRDHADTAGAQSAVMHRRRSPVEAALVEVRAAEERRTAQEAGASAEFRATLRPNGERVLLEQKVGESRLGGDLVASVPLHGTVRPRSATRIPLLEKVRADDIESIEVIKGGTLNFSGALAGVVWIKLKTETSRTSW